MTTEQGPRGGAPRSWFHGCWLHPGHFVFTETGEWSKACPFATHDHGGLDGGYAPRRMRGGRSVEVFGRRLQAGEIVFRRMGGDDDKLRNDIEYASEELPEGQYLYHQAVLGCSLISWWDRTQGDTRGGCNSTFVVDAIVPAGSMVALFKERFPMQAQRLAGAGVELVQIVTGDLPRNV